MGLVPYVVGPMANTAPPLPHFYVAPHPFRFASVLPYLCPAGQEPNAGVVEQFNAGLADAEVVLRATSACLASRHGDLRVALSCLHALERCGRQNRRTGHWETVYPNAYTYNSAMCACVRQREPAWALQLFRHLCEQGPNMPVPVFASTSTYNVAIDACDKLGLGHEAVLLFYDLAACGPQLPVPAFPDVYSYTSAISACDKSGMVDQALQLFDHLLECGPSFPIPAYPNIITFDALISACVRAGHFHQCPYLLRLGIEGVPGRPETRVFQSSLGFDAALNRLDLHTKAVLCERSQADIPGRNPGVHPAVAKAIFHTLLNVPESVFGEGASGIDQQTEFIVGWHGAGTVRQAITDCMLEAGWAPTNPPGLDGRPNPGALVTCQPDGQ